MRRKICNISYCVQNIVLFFSLFWSSTLHAGSRLGLPQSPIIICDFYEPSDNLCQNRIRWAWNKFEIYMPWCHMVLFFQQQLTVHVAVIWSYSQLDHSVIITMSCIKEGCTVVWQEYDMGEQCNIYMLAVSDHASCQILQNHPMVVDEILHSAEQNHHVNWYKQTNWES